MGNAGKYIRHLIAALIGALAAAVAAWAATRFGIQFADEQIKEFSDAAANALMPMVLVWWYSWSEKFLKRFHTLDPEGFHDRIALKMAADTDEEDR